MKFYTFYIFENLLVYKEQYKIKNKKIKNQKSKIKNQNQNKTFNNVNNERFKFRPSFTAAFTACASSILSDQVSYKNYKLIHIRPQSEAHLNDIANWENEPDVKT